MRHAKITPPLDRYLRQARHARHATIITIQLVLIAIHSAQSAQTIGTTTRIQIRHAIHSLRTVRTRTTHATIAEHVRIRKVETTRVHEAILVAVIQTAAATQAAARIQKVALEANRRALHHVEDVHRGKKVYG